LKKRAGFALVVLVALLVVSCVIAVSRGSVNIPWRTSLLILVGERGDWPASYERILLGVRVPRVLMAAVVGGSLSVAGVSFQALLQNPMADPYIIGVSAGAALGATVGIIGLGSLGFKLVPPLAFLGALGAMTTVYMLAKRGPRVPVVPLLLSGVAVSAFLSAVVSLLMVTHRERLDRVVFWLMGGLTGASWERLLSILPYTVVGFCIMYYFSRDLNALLFGEEQAAHLGVEVERVKAILLFTSTLVTAAAVSVTGLIGFVGLIVPHLMRLLTSPDHRILLPAAALGGASLLVVSDMLSRTLLSPAEIPVGILTAMMGGPFFLYLLYRRKGGM